MDWTLDEIQRCFLSFMEANGHAVIEGHPVPTHRLAGARPRPPVRSPTDDMLFTTAGMQPLTRYLRGEEDHPAGKRLTNVQRCVRSADIEQVGDNTHLTVCEMLGGWSLGDYGRETAIPLSFWLLTEGFGIDPTRLYVTVFVGNDEVPADVEALTMWSETLFNAGVDPLGRITPLGAEDNWWSDGPAGLCGPDTEIFVYTGDDPSAQLPGGPEFVEIGKHVFMNFNRSATGRLEALDQRNVDTGMGLERLAMVSNGHTTVWQTDELAGLRDQVASALAVAEASLDGDRTRSLAIVADHLRAALAIAAAGIRPAPSRHGYVLRKLVRRAARHAELLMGTDADLRPALSTAVELASAITAQRWPETAEQAAKETIDNEVGRFSRTLRSGVEQLHQLVSTGASFDGELAFRLADTLGYPAELAAEEADRLGMAMEPAWEDRYLQLREQRPQP